MAKQEDQFEDALGSIFDFVFANSSKPSRPLQNRPSGVSGSDEFTKALAELAMKPYTYLPNSMMMHGTEPIKGVKLASIKIGGDEDLEVDITNVAAALKDPNKCVDGIFNDEASSRKVAGLVTGARYLDVGIAMAGKVSQLGIF